MKFYLVKGDEEQYIAVSQKSIFMYVVGLPLIYVDMETDKRAAFIRDSMKFIGEDITQAQFERKMVDIEFPEGSGFATTLIRYKLEANEEPTVIVVGESSFSLN